ncbi:MAG: hypothetical protein FWG75_05655 [Cystobacterineae bacterium]|nr:hypothetical protein [Cystobacterineae bacterium]
MTPSKIIFLSQATVLLLVAACVKTITPPPLAGFPLQQEFRDWRSIQVCHADEQLIESELTRFNEFADDFLQDTSAKTKLSENQQIALLEVSPQLKPLLDGFGNLLFQTPNCSFSKNPRIMSLVRKASALLSLSRQRLQQSPTLLGALKESTSMALWKKTQPAAIEKARKEWCPPPEQRSPAPDIFYVSEDEELRKEWLFCDGTRVVSESGKETSLIPSKNPLPKYRSYPKRLYFEAAESYPDNQIHRPPRGER